jgi:hypothetical protein
MRKNNVPYPEIGVAHCKMQVGDGAAVRGREGRQIVVTPPTTNMEPPGAFLDI